MKGWKTFGLNLAVGVIGLLTAAIADAPLDPKYVGLAVSVLGGIGMYLRSITTTPLGQG